MKRKTRKSSDDSSCTLSGTFLGIQGTPSVVVFEDEAKRLRYAHHAVIDELQTDLPMEHRNPASRYLSGQVIDSGYRATLLADIDALEVSPSRWLPGNMTQIAIPEVPHGQKI